MVATRGAFDGAVTITVLVPAQARTKRLGATLDSLYSQTRPPERVVVVTDNCTDATESIARASGAEVYRDGWQHGRRRPVGIEPGTG